MGQDVSVVNSLRMLAEVGNNPGLTQVEKKRELKEILNGHASNFKGKPLAYLYPNGEDYFVVHSVLTDDTHVLYVHCGNKGESAIIHDITDHEELANDGDKLLKDIKHCSNKLHKHLKEAGVDKHHVNTAGNYLVDARSVEASDRVQKLLGDLDTRLEKYTSVKGGTNNINSVNLLYKIQNYMSVSNSILSNPAYNIPIQGDVLYGLTEHILGSLPML